MLTREQLDLLAKDFPGEALSADTSRGFELTSIKAAFVIERLNDVFGMCGQGWRYAHSNVQEINGELVAEVLVQYRMNEGGTFAYMWMDGHLTPIGEQVWSEPIFAYGGKKPLGKGSGPMTDAHKSTVTDGLTKAASMLGIGHSVFKGKGMSNKTSRPSVERPVPSKPTPKVDTSAADGPTLFYSTAKEVHGAKLPESVLELARRAQNKDITWDQALLDLRSV